MSNASVDKSRGAMCAGGIHYHKHYQGHPPFRQCLPMPTDIEHLSVLGEAYLVFMLIYKLPFRGG